MRAFRSGAVLFCSLALLSAATAADFKFKQRLVPLLDAQVPKILAQYDAQTGRFGEGLFVVADQNRIYELAAAYVSPGGKYRKDPKLLDAIMRGGDLLIEKQDENGMWRFDKKDGSYWGQIYMPWTYSRWIRAFAVIKADMPPERRARWEAALTKGFDGMCRTVFDHIQNIPTHDAMALYIAGGVMQRPDWQKQAAEYLYKVVAAQQEGGYWTEHAGPVINYNFVYIDAIGVYYLASGDKAVLPALEKAARFHSHFLYPDGSSVETVDERNAYHPGAGAANAGFTVSPEGRAYLEQQWNRLEWKLSADLMATCLLYGQEGPKAELPTDSLYTLVEGGQPRALTLRQSPWFLVYSGYTTTLAESRWIQDRQNLVSVWHDQAGLIIGGGNTKLQPAWSTFTVGDMAALRHTPGDEKPSFKAKGELYWMPSEGVIGASAKPTLDLTYGPVACRVAVQSIDATRLSYEVSASGKTALPVLAHVTLLPRMGAALATAGGFKGKLGEEPLALDAKQLGGQLDYGKVRLLLPAGTTLHWPTLPHNPYRKDGRATAEEGRIELRIPLTPDGKAQSITVEVQPAS